MLTTRHPLPETFAARGAALRGRQRVEARQSAAREATAQAPPSRGRSGRAVRVLRRLRAALVAMTALGCAVAGRAAEPVTDAPNEPAVAATSPGGNTSPLDRTSPRDTVIGFLAATDAGDYDGAGRFLDLATVPTAQHAAMARMLRAVLDRQVWIDPEAISNDAEGNAADGLPPQRESLGWLDTPDGARAVLLQRFAREGGQRWLFSAATVSAAARVYEVRGYGRIAELLPAALVDHQFLRLQLWQWVALPLLALVAYLAAWIVSGLAAWILRPLTRRTRTAFDERALALAAGPVRLIVAVSLFSAARLPLGLTAAARGVLSVAEYVLIVLAVTCTVLRAIDVITTSLRERLVERGQNDAVNFIPPGRRTAKVCIVALAGVAVLNGFGFNVTAILAALGVGGIAVALAAQKSIENLFGAITLYADGPVRVGDFCRFADTVGTVEDIGLRSTRIRTLERSVVSIPNAEFSNLQIDNYSRRDKFWYHPIIGLRYETTPEQLRYVLVEVRRMLYAHPKVDPNPARVRFKAFGAFSLDLEVFAYVLAPDYDGFLEVAEDLNLRILDIVADAGSSFAFPSQTTYLEHGTGLDAERSRRAEETVADWRAHDALFLPRFPAERINALKGTLEYPAHGAPRAGDGNGGRQRR